MTSACRCESTNSLGTSLDLYWPQARPFAAGTAVAETPPPYGSVSEEAWDGVLVQDRGGQRPRVLRLIREEHQRGCSLPRELPGDRKLELLREVGTSIREMPLWRLHVIAGQGEFRFLYRRGDNHNEILLEPGIAACLSGFSPLIGEVVRAAWLRFVLRCNPHLLGTSASQLEAFLFPSDREGLAAWRPVLDQLQGSDCFYCGTLMRDAVVDHFLPWSRYPRDLGDNFVLAHAECNVRKRDHLASLEHLVRWRQRNDVHGERMAGAFDRARLPHDWPTVRRVARSLYSVAENAGARVWHGGSELVALEQGWRGVLGCA